MIEQLVSGTDDLHFSNRQNGLFKFSTCRIQCFPLTFKIPSTFRFSYWVGKQKENPAVAGVFRLAELLG